MGFFGGLSAEQYDRQYTDRQLLGRISEYFEPQKKRLLAVSGLVIAIAGVGAMLPVVVSRGVDLVADAIQGISLEGTLSVTNIILLIGLALFFVGVGIWGLNWARRALVVRSVGDVVLELRAKAFHAAAEHDLSFYDQFSSGRIVSRISSDANDFG
mgnify:CR=1 FL=1